MNTQVKETSHWRFILFAILGIGMFLIPIPVGDEITIGVGIMASYVQGLLGESIPIIVTVLLVISAVGSIIVSKIQPTRVMENGFIRDLFYVSNVWLIWRILGAIFAIVVIFQVGPSWIWDSATGGEVLGSLVPVLFTWFLFAGLFLPILTEYGLMEFFGTLLRKIVRPLFTAPGRSSVDMIVSWLGSGTVGVLVTMQQYERGFYTGREAAVIATNFNIASIAFSILIVQFLDISHMFIQFYITVCVAGFIAAVITPRIPPLSWKKDKYYERAEQITTEDPVPENTSVFKWGYHKAVTKASNTPSAGVMLKQGSKNVLDIWFGLLPLVMSLGTLALIIAEYTQIFHIISYPFVPFLQLLQIPEASDAAVAVVVGFADMFLPAIVGSGIDSELTRFVIACVSMTQLVYMSEVGVLILRSKIPLNLLDLVLVFIIRTLITLPIIAFMAHFLFF
ncbi:membrane protein [Bacillaceae bacterium JMAK1]|nr:membrane protein [Bacillaceae bacterium JMAK1]